MKALILAGGRGQRLDDLSASRNKCMVEVKGRPVVEYSLDYAAATDVEEIVVVVGYRAEEIINHFGTRYRDKRLRYVIQWEQRGLVHAVECARDAMNGADFLLLLGDEVLLHPRHQEMLNAFRNRDLFALCGVLRTDDREAIKRTYTLIQGEGSRIYRLVEKPRAPLNDLMGTGDCVFRNEIFQYIAYTPVHHERKEKELPDLIQCAIDDGKVVQSFIVCDGYANINAKEDILVADTLLSRT